MRRQRVGDYLVKDDGTGVVRWASDTVVQWDGTLQHKKNAEGPHPQWFVQAMGDPYPVSPVRPERTYPLPDTFAPLTVGTTSSEPPKGAAYHLFDKGIGEMRVGFSFVVR